MLCNRCFDVNFDVFEYDNDTLSKNEYIKSFINSFSLNFKIGTRRSNRSRLKIIISCLGTSGKEKR